MLKKEGGDKIESCNHPTPEVLNSLQKLLKKKVTNEIDKCNHTTPEAYNSLQKVLKKKVNIRFKKNNIRSIVPCRKCSKKKVELRLKNVTILHLRFHSSFQNQHDTCVDCYYIMVGGS